RSMIDHDLQGENAKVIRLGFRLVKGLSVEGQNLLVRERPPLGFKSVSEVKAIGLSRRDLESLASADAFRCLSDNRYETRWQLMNPENSLPFMSSTVAEEPIGDFRFKPKDIENLTEDYASLGLSLDHHPITLMEKANLLGNFVRSNQLSRVEHKSFVDVVGLVTGRQSPGTASGVTFMTLEDDTGNINVVVWAGTARAQKQPFLMAKVLKIKG
ncbi:OB-fold nucleic acid binding domain-containing protein, partial [Oleiphilus sp. HI0125]